MDYLVHHGIMGQKWGIRRYQNEDGTLTEEGKARLRKYQDKESIRLDKKYDKRIERSEKKVAKLEEKGAKEKRINRVKEYGEALKSNKFIESEYVRNMTYNDMMDEKKAVGNSILASVLASGLASAILLPTTGFVVGFGASADSIKESRRLEDWKNKSAEEQRKSAKHSDDEPRHLVYYAVKR